MHEFEAVDILLVEDNDADAEMTTRALRRGNVVNRLMRVRDGVEALEFVFREGTFIQRGGSQPKLILLDLKMPKLGGIEVLRRLKGDDRTKMIPVVMLTSSAEERDIVESYGLGVNSYLVKPVNFSTFTDVVSQAGLYWAVMNRLPS
ncbi:MAG TPA: response regulator [Steroidobacteraceae bacterium]|nr:response regulator [Steroidobacteraceae bacterium]